MVHPFDCDCGRCRGYGIGGDLEDPREHFCECCGQPEGTCPQCGTRHAPATPGGCERCDEEAA